jgi:hypothetical protein
MHGKPPVNSSTVRCRNAAVKRFQSVEAKTAMKKGENAGAANPL